MASFGLQNHWEIFKGKAGYLYIQPFIMQLGCLCSVSVLCVSITFTLIRAAILARAKVNTHTSYNRHYMIYDISNTLHLSATSPSSHSLTHPLFHWWCHIFPCSVSNPRSGESHRWPFLWHKDNTLILFHVFSRFQLPARRLRNICTIFHSRCMRLDLYPYSSCKGHWKKKARLSAFIGEIFFRGGVWLRRGSFRFKCRCYVIHWVYHLTDQCVNAQVDWWL